MYKEIYVLFQIFFSCNLHVICLSWFAAIYPLTFEEWQTVESISGMITVFHTKIGSILYNGKLASTLASQGIFFYDALYVLPTSQYQYGKVQ